LALGLSSFSTLTLPKEKFLKQEKALLVGYYASYSASGSA
jgi:hypothetical protein